MAGSPNPVELSFPLEGFSTVKNPFGQSLDLGLNLNELYRNNPEAAAAKVEELAAKIHADGPVVYVLEGAEPRLCSPMQYGGQYLETDREILARLTAQTFVILLVKGYDGAYLDFVSDLDAQIFAWDARETGFTLAQMRELRTGLLATNEPGADVFVNFRTAAEVAV